MIISYKEIELWKIVPPLLTWYDENARVLPWRENTEPYRIWVSEIMLQQTGVETVKPYFIRFVEQIPDIKSLADAGEEQLLKLWEGLGYYSRVRNLQKAARVIIAKHQGQFPESYDSMLLLPGIGSYTAGAISSICYGKPVPAVDGNVLRVVARLLGSDADIARADVKTQMTEILREIYPVSRSGDFTQSLMELGATVCLPKSVPKCGSCPVSFLCRAYQTGAQMTLPVKSKKKPRKKEQKTVLLLCLDDKIAVRQREMDTLLGGLWEFPNMAGHLTESEAKSLLEQWGIFNSEMSVGIVKRHIFTHVEWDMISYVVICGNISEKFYWVTKERLERQMALPAAFQAFWRSAYDSLSGEPNLVAGSSFD